MRTVHLMTGFLFASMSLHAAVGTDDHKFEQEAERLLSSLTLEEKASLTSGRDAWSTQPIERLEIPYIWVADGPHGLRRAPSTDTWGYGDQAPATCFPTASALSATWDLELVHRVGQALGDEAQALGVNVLLGPGVNIKRSPLGGRNFEYFSEDPLLAGELAAAYIRGVQSRGVGTSLKHYAANNQETQRMFMNSAVDDRTLNEIYLTPFEIAIKKAQPWTVMACYNRVQGVYGSQSPALLHRKLKEEWGFEGIVISDWDAVIDRVEGIRAGMHLEMPGKPGHLTNHQVIDAVKNGDLDEARLDELVREILAVVLKADASARTGADQKLEAHHALARQVASEAIVLLKNDDGLLPLSPGRHRKIAVVGEFAVEPRYQGNGSSEVKPPRVDRFLDVIRAEYGEEVDVSYAQGYELDDDKELSLIPEAVRTAQAADVVLVLAGLPQQYESEGIDRTHIDLPPSHNALIAEIAKAQKNLVVVLTNGSAVAMPWVNDVTAILESWLGGQAGAGAVADVLFGAVNPSGKLTETFPARLQDTPAFLNFPGEEGEAIYGERMFVGYRYFDVKEIKPLFPFGHGLSYTTFAYDDMTVSSRTITDREGLTVTANIENTGEVAGKEVVQLYVSDPVSRLQRPVRELKGFTKVSLEPGERQEVRFTLSARDFSYYDSKQARWIAESGEFEISIGASSRDLRLGETIQLQSTQELNYVFDEFTFLRELWENEQMQPLL
ncbi:MAG: glycosyl hydrolase, partial [Xanthomonadales bacterium]|nr:glycosyl hydrolase [Xanthomonadales bacterium]